MKVLIVGGTGTLGKHIAERLTDTHELIIAGRQSGDVQVDITDPHSIEQLYQKTGRIDALIVAAGGAPVKPLEEMIHEDFLAGFQSKMMGQINLVLTGIRYINSGGSITLTSGILTEEPIPQGAILSTINSAVNGFVKGAYGELFKKGIRINAVSPALVEDSVEKLGSLFLGHTPIPVSRAVDAYVKSLESLQTGRILEVF